MMFVMRRSAQTVRNTGSAAPYLSLILIAHFLQTVLGKGSLGRGFLSFLIQMILLVPLLGVAAGLAAAVYIASGLSLAAAVVTALLILLIELVPMLVLVGQAFNRFDPATEMAA